MPNNSFPKKPISEVISFLSVCLLVKINTNMKFKPQWHKISHISHELPKNISLSTVLKLKEIHAILEYQVALYGLFVERLLNKKWNLSRENIVEESKLLESIIDYFTNWIGERDRIEKEEKI